MYFPIGWSKSLKIRLKSSEFFNQNPNVNQNLNVNENENSEQDDFNFINCDEHLLSIKTSSDKSFLYVLTNFSLRIWFCKVND